MPASRFHFGLQAPASDISFLSIVDGETLFNADGKAGEPLKQATIRQIGWHPVDMPAEWFISDSAHRTTVKVMQTMQCTIQYLSACLRHSERKLTRTVEAAKVCATERDSAFEELVELREMVALYKKRSQVATHGASKSVKSGGGGANNTESTAAASGLVCSMCGNAYPSTHALQSHYKKRHKQSAEYASVAAASAAVSKAVTGMKNKDDMVTKEIECFAQHADEPRGMMAIRSELCDVRMSLAKLTEQQRSLSPMNVVAIPGVGCFPTVQQQQQPVQPASSSLASTNEEVVLLREALGTTSGRLLELERILVQATEAAVANNQSGKGGLASGMPRPLNPTALFRDESRHDTLNDLCVSPITQPSPSAYRGSTVGVVAPIHSVPGNSHSMISADKTSEDSVLAQHYPHTTPMGTTPQSWGNKIVQNEQRNDNAFGRDKGNTPPPAGSNTVTPEGPSWLQSSPPTGITSSASSPKVQGGTTTLTRKDSMSPARNPAPAAVVALGFDKTLPGLGSSGAPTAAPSITDSSKPLWPHSVSVVRPREDPPLVPHSNPSTGLEAVATSHRFMSAFEGKSTAAASMSSTAFLGASHSSTTSSFSEDAVNIMSPLQSPPAQTIAHPDKTQPDTEKVDRRHHGYNNNHRPATIPTTPPPPKVTVPIPVTVTPTLLLKSHVSTAPPPPVQQTTTQAPPVTQKAAAAVAVADPPAAKAPPVIASAMPSSGKLPMFAKKFKPISVGSSSTINGEEETLEAADGDESGSATSSESSEYSYEYSSEYYDEYETSSTGNNNAPPPAKPQRQSNVRVVVSPRDAAEDNEHEEEESPKKEKKVKGFFKKMFSKKK